jgi:hypothetical protein
MIPPPTVTLRKDIMAELTRLLTDRADPAHSRIETGPSLSAGPGEIVLAPDRFSLTTNNITYAVYGDAMRYWDFFPTGEAGWGHIPVWGFADIVESQVDGLSPGERIYGYFPIASQVRMTPQRVSGHGFTDAAAHRAELPPAYNQYSRVSADPSYSPQRESYQALYRPLFMTAFLLADFLTDADAFGAKRLILSSASSKTAYATAYCLGGDRFERIGLTSPRNADYVAGLGCYETVCRYEAVETLAADTPAVYVDFSGNVGLRERIHMHFGDRLMHDCVVGSTDNDGFAQVRDLPGPRPAFFFAPDRIRKRHADWGAAEFNRRYQASESGFLDHLDAADPAWVRVDTHAGFAGARTVLADLAQNGGDPAVGHVIEL